MATSMPLQPTLIVLATPTLPAPLTAHSTMASRPAWPDFQHIAHTLDTAQDAGLAVVLMASRWIKQQCEVFAPDVVCQETELLPPQASAGTHWVRALAQAVQLCPQAPGWLVMPTPMPQLAAPTLVELCRALQRHALVRPVHRMQAGYPLGFSGEFYSELVRLDAEADLRRLLARYPLSELSTDDPGVLAHAGWPDAKHGDARPWRHRPAGE